MNEQIFCIVFSILLFPINFCCSFWLFKEALNLSEMTVREFVKDNYSKTPIASKSSHRLKRTQRFIAKFFHEKSSDAKKSIRLTRTFGFCTFLGLPALMLAFYSAISVQYLDYVLIADLILFTANVIIFVCGRIYSKNNPLDPSIEEELSRKRAEEGNLKFKSIIIYFIVALFFFGFLFFFMITISNTFTSNHVQEPTQSASNIQQDLILLLSETGYETADVSTTFWKLDEHKVCNVAAGVKGESRFEFYSYTDSETVDLVYNQIVYQTAPNLENDEREKYETILSKSSKIFEAEIDESYYLVMYKNNTVIYAFSKTSPDEFHVILKSIGYL